MWADRRAKGLLSEPHSQCREMNRAICSAIEEKWVVASRSNRRGTAVSVGSSQEGSGQSKVDNKKAKREHQKDPEREDGKLMRTEGNKRKTIE